MLQKSEGFEERLNLLAGEQELKDFETHIKRFLKTSFSSSAASLIDSARNATLNDYLNMSKL